MWLGIAVAYAVCAVFRADIAWCNEQYEPSELRSDLEHRTKDHQPSIVAENITIAQHRKLFKWLRVLREGHVLERKSAIAKLTEISEVYRRDRRVATLVPVALARALHDGESEVRLTAARALANWGNAAIRLVRPALMARRIEVRLAAIEALGLMKLDNNQVSSILLALLRDPHPFVRKKVLHTLAPNIRISQHIRRGIYLMSLHDPQVHLRHAAAKILSIESSKTDKPSTTRPFVKH